MIDLYGTFTSLGSSDPNEVLQLTVMLRADPKVPHKRDMAPADYNKTVQWLSKNNLTVQQTHHAAKQLQVSGKIKDVEKAFGITFGKYQSDTDQKTYRRYTGTVTMPDEIISVLGLTDLPVIMKRSFAVNPPNTVALPVSTLKTLYNFPTNTASGQVIGLFESSATTHSLSDIQLYFNGTGETMPTIVNVMASDNPQGDPSEPTLDICAAGSAALGCTIAMYYMPLSSPNGIQAVIDVITRMVHRWPNDPACDIISLSYSFFDDGSAFDLATNFLHNSLQSLFQDAAALGISVLASTGDHGTGLAQAEFNNPSDGFAYVVEPSINPYCLAIGGTVVGNVNLPNKTFEEYIWAENSTIATGGGVSQFWPVPSYQQSLSPLPTHVNTGQTGRGEPDLAANASSFSGLRIFVNGAAVVIGGTSYSCPLIGGLLAVINAATGKRCGMIHPVIYANPSIFRDIDTTTLGPPSNATGGAPGYNARAGWDGSTGLGIPDGQKLLTAIQNSQTGLPTLAFADDGGTSTLPVKGVQGGKFAFTHGPLPAGSHSITMYFNGGQSTTTNFTVATPTAPAAVQNLTAKAGANNVSASWYPPSSGNPPYTYQVLSSRDNVSFIPATTGTSALSFTITGLSAGNVWVRVSAIGPTGLIGTATTVGPFNVVNPTAVTNGKAYAPIGPSVSNFMAFQWDDVGADSYDMYYSTSSTGPWILNLGSPFSTGWGANNVSSPASGLPASYGHPSPARDLEVHSLNTGPINASHFSTTGRDYFFRIDSHFGSSIIQSAALGPFTCFDQYPKISFGMCQCKVAGRLDIQWVDLYPNTDPQTGTGSITYTVIFWQTSASTILFQASNIISGFGVNRSSQPGNLNGNVLSLTGIPAGIYAIQVVTSNAPDSFSGRSSQIAGGASLPLDGSPAVQIL